MTSFWLDQPRDGFSHKCEEHFRLYGDGSRIKALPSIGEHRKLTDRRGAYQRGASGTISTRSMQQQQKRLVG